MDAPDGRVAVGRSIRLVVVALVTALAVAACGGKDEAAPQATATDTSAPQVVADGKHMPVDRSGPIRIVFPDSSSLGRNPDLWIWSVATMKVA
jgi:hypothetical protein